VKSTEILSLDCRNREQILVYLEGVAASCGEVANKPQPKMLDAISGVLRLVRRTIAEICGEQI
jgi:hypothetical protein